MLTLKKARTEKRPNFGDIVYKGGILYLSQRTYVMGILNRTPDSFSDGGNFFDEKNALGHIERMVKEGADIIDVGGESTRPGSKPVSLKEEMNRVIPIIRKTAANINIPISIDTQKSEVAEAALDAGASIVNDITALRGDFKMREVVARRNAPVILMHMRGTPQAMQANVVYADLLSEIISYLEASIAMAKGAGIAEDKIIIDPGIGFGKTAQHNLSILKNLSKLKILKRPILVGASRKSFIGNVLKLEVNRRLLGTAASVVISIINGANIVRVHDAEQMFEVVRMTEAINQAE